MLSLAVTPEGTAVGLHAAFRQVEIGLLLAIDNLHGLSDSWLHLQVFIIHHRFHVVDDEELLDVEVFLTNIIAIETDEIGACHIDTTLREYPFLVCDVWRIFLQLCLLAVELRKTGTLHLVDRPAIARPAQDVNSAIASLAYKRSLADVLHAFIHPLARLLRHRCEVEFAVRQFSMCLLEVAKELHGEIAHDISLFKTSLHTSINSCFFRLIHLQPEILRALAESRVT